MRLVRRTVPHGGSILEHGCAAVGILIYLSNHGFRRVAFDVTREALRRAMANERAEGNLSRECDLTFVQASALALPFLSDTFDCAMSDGLLEHFAPDVVPLLLGEMVRVLKSNGLLVADIAHRRGSTRQLVKLLTLLASYLAQVVRYKSFEVL